MEDELSLIGKIILKDKEQLFGIKTDDRRRHMYIIGRTGVGKTTLEETLALYDIEHNKGIGVIDPHGEMSERLLKFIPKNRIDDVVYFNPADYSYPLAFNVMEYVEPQYRHMVASGLLSVFEKIWPDVWSSRMEYILNNTILALLEYPDSTLLHINRMLADKDFRKEVVNNLTDEVVKAFWLEEFERYHERFQVEAIAPIQNKVGQFISNPLIRNIVGQQKSKINLREIIDSRKILIARLPVGLIGETNVSLLGGLLVTKLQQAAMSRIDIPEENRQDFFLFIDEFQNFATESFINILAEARKYRLNLTLANQYLEQLPENLRAAILGTIGTLVIFRIGARDAEVLKKEFEPFLNEQDLINLPKYNFYIKLMIDGVVSNPFLASTLAPRTEPLENYVEEIIALSRLKYSNRKEDVEMEIGKEFKKTNSLENVGQAKSNSNEKRETILYEAVCSNCNKKIQVPFKPDPNRPVYCKNCLKKIRAKTSKPEVLKQKF